MTIFRKQISPESNLPLWYARIVLAISVMVYTIPLRTMGIEVGKGNSQGGATGLGNVVLFVLILAIILFLAIQIPAFRVVRRRWGTPAAALLLPLPIVLLVPACISTLELENFSNLPQSSGAIVFVNLLLADFFLYLALYSRYLAAIRIAAVHATITLLFALFCWVTYLRHFGAYHHIEHTPVIDLRDQNAEGAPKRNADGSPIISTRYMSTDHHKPDSELLYFPSSYWLMSKRILFDSAGAEYERTILYTESGLRYKATLENHTTLERTLTEYFPDTKDVSQYMTVFDSNRTRYRRQTIYNMGGEVEHQALIDLRKRKTHGH